MERTAHSHRTFVQERSARRRVTGYSPSLLATGIGYFLIFYIYSALGLTITSFYPAIRVSYFLYFLLATLPFLLAVNRSTIEVFRDHWPVILMFSLYFVYISIQFALFDISDVQIVRETYVEKGQFITALLVSLVAFELSFGFRKILGALYIVTVLSCLINVVEFFRPGLLIIHLSSVPGRAAGLFQNPNASALFIASAVPLLGARMQGARRFLFYGMTGIATFLTFSRGGWAIWLAAVIITEIGRTDWKHFRLDSRSIGLIAAGGIGAIGLLIAMGPSLSLLISGLGSNLDSNTTARLERLANDTTISRLQIARQGLIAFASAPILGHGIGYTVQWIYGNSTHNMFVLMLAEQGLVGFIWLLILLVVWWRYPRPSVSY